jgi:hypothetical protein
MMELGQWITEVVGEKPNPVAKKMPYRLSY